MIALGFLESAITFSTNTVESRNSDVNDGIVMPAR